MSEPNQEQNKKNNTNRFLVFLVILLSLGLGITLWQYFELRKTVSQKGTEIEVLNDERGELQSELEEMLSELDSMETDNDSMKVELSNRKNEIEDLLAKVKDKDFAIYKLKKETTTLRTIMRGYVVTIDSLNTLNVGLRNENEQVRNTLSQERLKSQKLKKSNENLESTVEIASRLDVSDVSVFGVRVKRDMTGKETDRAKRTDKIRVCFTIGENKVAKIEKKNLYLRILSPDGNILTAGETDKFKFSFNGVRGFYSDKIEIDYNRASKEFCMDWTKPTDDYEILPGKYLIFLYAEDYEMASTSFEFK